MKKLILEYQNKWASGIVEIGKTKNNFKESVSVTTKFINELYDFENGNVQFKPTKASEKQFTSFTFKLYGIFFVLFSSKISNPF